MNPDTSLRLRTQTEAEHTLAQQPLHATQHQAGHEFASVEEMLRHDHAQTEVPPVVAERLKDSIAQEPKPSRPWWRRWFG